MNTKIRFIKIRFINALKTYEKKNTN